MVVFGLVVLLMLLLIWVQIKIEIKVTRQERWVEVRYLLLKYRIALEVDEIKKLKVFKAKSRKKKQRRLSRTLSINEIKEIVMIVKKILYRFLSCFKINRLDSTLHFSIDDPFINAQLLAVFLAIEANCYRFLQKRLKKTDHHRFNISSQFAGNQLFLETSCIVSVRIGDIMMAALLSLKNILKIKKMIKIEKRCNDVRTSN